MKFHFCQNDSCKHHLSCWSLFIVKFNAVAMLISQCLTLLTILKHVENWYWHSWSSYKVWEAVIQRCSVKKVFLKISQNSEENICARVSFLIKLQTWGLTFSSEFWKIFKNIFFYRTPLVAASKVSKMRTCDLTFKRLFNR